MANAARMSLGQPSSFNLADWPESWQRAYAKGIATSAVFLETASKTERATMAEIKQCLTDKIQAKRDFHRVTGKNWKL